MEWETAITPTGAKNYILYDEKNEFRISYNDGNHYSEINKVWEWGINKESKDETALIDQTGDEDIFYILNGDFRKEFEKEFTKGFSALINLFNSLKEKHESIWSSNKSYPESIMKMKVVDALAIIHNDIVDNLKNLSKTLDPAFALK